MNKYLKALSLMLCTLVCSSTLVATGSAVVPRQQTFIEQYCAGTQQFMAGFAAFACALGGMAYTLRTFESVGPCIDNAIKLFVNAGHDRSQVAKLLYQNGKATFACAIATVGLFKAAQWLARYSAGYTTPETKS